jgi:DNA repair exonuclease SbcCD ATPase subunit
MNHNQLFKPSEIVSRKILESFDVSNFEIETDSGFQPISKVVKTIQYQVFILETGDGFTLECADDHIVFDESFNEIFVKNLKVGNKIKTRAGDSEIKSIIQTDRFENMYDVQVDSDDHRYYTNDIVSHNTTIINALCYVLFNKPFDNISLQRLINSTNATKNTLMQVGISFTKGLDEYEIIRSRGESYSISITKNGDDITPGKGVTECDNFIQDIIGISFELFTKTVIFSGNSQAFLALPIAQQRLHIEELLNITLLSEKAVKLKELIKQTEGDIKVQEAIIVQQQQARDTQKKHINDAEKRALNWETNRDTEIKKLQAELDLVSSDDLEAEQLLHAERDQLTLQISNQNAKLTPIKLAISNLQKTIKKQQDDIAHLEDAKCPYCLQDYAEAKDKLEALKTSLIENNTALDLKNTELAASNSDLAVLQEKLKDVKAKITKPNLEILLKARQNAAISKQRIEDLASTENPYVSTLEQLMLEDEVVIDTAKVDALKKRLDHQQFLLKLLTGKDSFIRKRIINRSVPFLNDRINFYTSSLGLPHIVKFDADMSCTVSEYGRELDFGNLSAGEKRRVNTALSLAFRDVLHRLHNQFNILLIDELDGQLDPGGIDAITGILKNKSRDEALSIYVISHHPLIDGRLDKKLIVQKEHGFSTIAE